MTTDTPILSEFLTPIELAAELRISPRTLVRWEAVGDAPAITRIRRQRLYRRSSVVAWLVAREASGGRIATTPDADACGHCRFGRSSGHWRYTRTGGNLQAPRPARDAP